MKLFCTLPNTGVSSKSLALIDPFNETINIFGFEWSDDIVGTTGLVKDDFGWIIITQNSDDTNGLVFLSNNYEFELYLPLKKIKDAHSITLCNGLLYVVSSGNNSIYEVWMYPTAKIDETLYYCFENHDEIDKIHLNGLCKHNAGEIKDAKSFMLTSFGEKDDYFWASANNGKLHHLMEKEKGKIECRIMKNKLQHPHSIKMTDGFFESYCESLIGTFCVGDKKICLKGYTRGIAYDEKYHYVGISESRNVSRSTGEEVKELLFEEKAAVCVIDRDKFEVVKRFIVSDQIKEIYDIEVVK